MPAFEVTRPSRLDSLPRFYGESSCVAAQLREGSGLVGCRWRGSNHTSSGTRNEIFISLMPAFKTQEAVVAAAMTIWVAAAHVRACGVDGAAPCVAIEETADRAIDMIPLVPEDPFVGLTGSVPVAESLAGNRSGDVEMRSDPVEIVVRDRDAWVRTAIARAAGTVIVAARCHVQRFSHGLRLLHPRRLRDPVQGSRSVSATIEISLLHARQRRRRYGG